MRIVTGSARGRTIIAPTGDTTRPTTDRVRESMFNALFSLGAVEGARVVDLFAGSGALGLEALSRGAAHCTFVDSSRAAINAITDNVEACRFTEESNIVTGDVFTWLGRANTPFDLVLCDPPYAFDEWSKIFDLLQPAPTGTTLVIESGREVEATESWSALRTRRYGSTIVSILESTPLGEDTAVVEQSAQEFPTGPDAARAQIDHPE